VYAVAILRGRDDRYHRLGFFLPFTLGAVITPFQIIAGDYAAKFLAHYQPTKLAAIEGVYQTGPYIPLTLGGVAVGDQLRYGLEIPDGLSLLVGYRPDTVVRGLNDTPRELWPPITVVHLSFDVMVGVGFFLLALGACLLFGWLARRRRGVRPAGWRVFLRLAAIAGPASVVALEAGWTVTEEGRQPWVVWGLMSVHDAVNPAPGLRIGLWLVLVVYAGMTVATVYVLRRLATGHPIPVAPRESDVEQYRVV